jgi:peptidyl-dipeptidase Dcp
MENPLCPRGAAHGGVPPFDKVQVAHFKPALEAAMAEQLAEIDRIAQRSAPPTFANTIEAMERSGRMLDRVRQRLRRLQLHDAQPRFQEVEREMEPRLAAFRDQVVQNEKLFKRIAAVYERARSPASTPSRSASYGSSTRTSRAAARAGCRGEGEALRASTSDLATL